MIIVLKYLQDGPCPRYIMIVNDIITNVNGREDLDAKALAEEIVRVRKKNPITNIVYIG